MEFVYEILDNQSIKIISYKGQDKVITIPSMISNYPVREIQSYAFMNLICTTIIIPHTINIIVQDAFADCNNLKVINVLKNNRYYASNDGILYNKDKTQLIYCPNNYKQTSLTTPSAITTIASHAFKQCIHIKHLYLSQNISYIGLDAFPLDMILHVYQDSYAHYYAMKHHFNYDIIKGIEKIELFKGEYRFLSNFYPISITYENIVYPSVEHAYQAAKTLNIDKRLEISQANSPGRAKYMGSLIEEDGLLRNDWEDIKLHIMHELVSIKFRDNGLKRLLLLTGDAMIIEGNRWNDTYWGVCDGIGENHLGQILMDIRERLKYE